MYVRLLKGATLSCAKHCFPPNNGVNSRNSEYSVDVRIQVVPIACHPKVPPSQRLKRLFVVIRKGIFLTSVYINLRFERLIFNVFFII